MSFWMWLCLISHERYVIYVLLPYMEFLICMHVRLSIWRVKYASFWKVWNEMNMHVSHNKEEKGNLALSLSISKMVFCYREYRLSCFLSAWPALSEPSGFWTFGLLIEWNWTSGLWEHITLFCYTEHITLFCYTEHITLFCHTMLC